nr:hypothetical protein [Actinomycetota bacterium]
TLGRAFAPLLGAVGLGETAARGVTLTVGFVLATVGQMVLGELGPKKLALEEPERFALALDCLAPVVIDDTLACLAHAQPPDGATTRRVLDDESHRLAFDAWTAARENIVAEWNPAADPANLQPAVPKAMRDAAALVRSDRPPSMTLEEADRLIDVLQAPYPERTLKQVRRVLTSADDATAKVEALGRLVTDLGLEPSPALEPLPEIEEDDVHLVCWLAIVPQD